MNNMKIPKAVRYCFVTNLPKSTSSSKLFSLHVHSIREHGSRVDKAENLLGCPGRRIYLEGVPAEHLRGYPLCSNMLHSPQHWSKGPRMLALMTRYICRASRLFNSTLNTYVVLVFGEHFSWRSFQICSAAKMLLCSLIATLSRLCGFR